MMDDITIDTSFIGKQAVDISFEESEGSEDDAESEEQTPFISSTHAVEDEESDNDDVDTREDHGTIASTSTFPLASSSQSRKAPAWTDADDVSVQVSLADNKRLRKLRDAPSDDIVGGKEYERRLRRQFERINPTPVWATKARKKLHPSGKQKRRRSSLSDETSSDDGVEDDQGDSDPLLTSTGGILGRPKSGTLSQGTLSIERLRDANISARSEGAVKAVQFHPKLPVLLAAGEDRRLKLFNVSLFAVFLVVSAKFSLRSMVTPILIFRLCIYPHYQ